MIRFLVVVFILSVAPVHAEEYTPALNPGAARTVMDVAGWISAGVNIAADVKHAYDQPDRKTALWKETGKVGLTILSSEIIKRVTHRERPDHSDMLSFWSEHAAIGASTSGWNLQISVPIEIFTGYSRMAADKHHPSDVIVGAIVGGTLGRLFK